MIVLGLQQLRFFLAESLLRDLRGRGLPGTFPFAQGLLATADNQQPDPKSQARKELSQLHHSKPFFPDRLNVSQFRSPDLPAICRAIGN